MTESEKSTLTVVEYYKCKVEIMKLQEEVLRRQVASLERLLASQDVVMSAMEAQISHLEAGRSRERVMDGQMIDLLNRIVRLGESLDGMLRQLDQLRGYESEDDGFAEVVSEPSE